LSEIADFLSKEIITNAMLVENVTVDDVSGWRWMRMYHRDLLEEWIENNKAQGGSCLVLDCCSSIKLKIRE